MSHICRHTIASLQKALEELSQTNGKHDGVPTAEVVRDGEGHYTCTCTHAYTCVLYVIHIHMYSIHIIYYAYNL